MRPWVGCIIAVKVMPTPTVETNTGKNTTARRYPRPKMSEVSSSASSRPSTTLEAEVTVP